MPAQAGPAPREPYSCRLYVDASRQCGVGNCDDRRLHRLKRECLRQGGRQGEAEQALELSRKKDPRSADLVRMMLVP